MFQLIRLGQRHIHADTDPGLGFRSSSGYNAQFKLAAIGSFYPAKAFFTLTVANHDLFPGFQPQDLCMGSIFTGQADALPCHFLRIYKKSCHTPSSNVT